MFIKIVGTIPVRTIIWYCEAWILSYPNLGIP